MRYVTIVNVAIIIGVAIATVSCSKPDHNKSKQNSQQPVAAEPAAFEDAKRAVLDRLKDPESARFGKMSIIHMHNGAHVIEVVCGQVNAKTEYGGYAGMTGFAYIGEATSLVRVNFQNPAIDTTPLSGDVGSSIYYEDCKPS